MWKWKAALKALSVFSFCHRKKIDTKELPLPFYAAPSVGVHET